MKEIFVHNDDCIERYNCLACPFRDSEDINRCNIADNICELTNCPIRSIENHDKRIKRQMAKAIITDFLNADYQDGSPSDIKYVIKEIAQKYKLTLGEFKQIYGG